MAQGKLLWFDAGRGFGFIRPDLGPRDVYVHASALADGAVPDIGAPVVFELIQLRDGRLTAQRVQPLAPAPRRGR